MRRRDRRHGTGKGRHRAGRAGRCAAWLIVALLPLAAAGGVEITFDDTSERAPEKFEDVWPGGEFGPVLDYGQALLDGAVIGWAVSPADQAATTLPQFYVTTDFLPLADDSLLPGEITVTLDPPESSVVLDVGNGNSFPASFTLTAFNGSQIVDGESVELEGFGNPGFVGTLEVVAHQITSFSVTSDQPEGSKLFSIDTVGLPEPDGAFALLAGIGALLALRSRRSRR